MGENINNIYAIVLAAGKGKRMKSVLPKVLHKLDGKALIDWVLDSLSSLKLDGMIVVTGFGRKRLIKHLNEIRSEQIQYAVQEELLGTADAVKCAISSLPETGTVIVLCGDVPLIRTVTLHKLLEVHKVSAAAVTVLTTILDIPAGYGRIVRNPDGTIDAIVEHRDATKEQRAIKEINSGTYIFNITDLRKEIANVTNDNVQREFYLPDVINLLRKRSKKAIPCIVDNSWEVKGINSHEQLREIEEYLKKMH